MNNKTENFARKTVAAAAAVAIVLAFSLGNIVASFSSAEYNVALQFIYARTRIRSYKQYSSAHTHIYDIPKSTAR